MIGVRAKTAPLVSSFHDHWVQMDNAGQHWWKIDHDTTKFPLYSAAAKTAFESEIDSFWAEVAYTNGGFKDLFLSNIGFVNKDNAPIYGLDASQYGTALTKVALDPTQRPGFMTRAGFLSSYSHFTDTAPILRGAFINVYIIGVNPGPPIAGATALQAPPGNYTTNREKVTALVNMSPVCMGCHTSIINPPGFVLENFDAIGRWQTVDQLGGPIDASATVNFGNGNIQPISSVQQLMQEIAQVPAAQNNYARYWVAYAYGRDLERERSMRRRPGRRQVDPGHLRHSQSPRRPHPSRLLPFASPRNSLKPRGAQNVTMRMHRRMFLRGLGGAVVAAPFLSSVWERAAKGQAATRPKQLIVMFTHYGCVTTKWFPAKSNGALVAGDLQNSIASLAPYAGKLLIPRGIRAMNEWTISNTGAGSGRGQGNDPHLNVVGSYFTLQPVTPSTNNPISFDQSTKFNAKPVGSSLDHVIAQQLSPQRNATFHAGWQLGWTGGETAHVEHLLPEIGHRGGRRSSGLSIPAWARRRRSSAPLRVCSARALRCRLTPMRRRAARRSPISSRATSTPQAVRHER